jgi:lipoprotein-anchoring transpeptidase ErfK/SrfK
MDSKITRLFCVIALAMLLNSCVTRDTEHKVVISVPEQRMVVFKQGNPLAEYPVSTSKFGLGDRPGSYATPLGRLEVEKKIGDYAPSGTVFRSRHQTGEVLPPDAPGRDPIVTRILWLRGLDPQNRNAYGRGIYIHGTVEERNIGKPVSYGCIRMKSCDVIELYNTIGFGAEVEIINVPLETVLPQTGG